MTTPGVGPVVALTYRATVDVPARFRKSKSVGAVFGLTCAKYQSGEIDRSGRISRCGDEMMRVMLYEAAQSMLRSKKWSWLKAWAMQIARRRGMKKAIVALARRLAVIMHRIWVDGTEFRWTRDKPRQQHDDRPGSDAIGGNSSSTERWNDVPRGTMDEVSSHVRLDLPPRLISTQRCRTSKNCKVRSDPVLGAAYYWIFSDVKAAKGCDIPSL